jgi:VIT1/CCC1 family predicted Fe2+/Mn2+ transporter
MHIKNAISAGMSFGLTSGVITTLGLMVGLTYSTQSKLAVLGGIATIAVADAFSDALGIHISEESQKNTSTKGIWESTFATLISKFVIAATFVVPVVFFSLQTSILVSITWGLLLLSVLSYVIAKHRKEKPMHVIIEHLSIATLVIVVTFVVGRGIAFLVA